MAPLIGRSSASDIAIVTGTQIARCWNVESVLDASNQGVPAIHMKGSDVSEAYKDVVRRFLGEKKPMRFVDAEKPSFFKRVFGGR